MSNAALHGKVALVTGGCSGIGKATVLAFVNCGVKIVISDVDAEAGHAFADELQGNGANAIFVRTDVTQAAQVEALIKTALAAFGRLDIAHNNVGGGSLKAGVIHLTRHAAVTHGKYNIRINLVSPGLTATPAVTASMTEQQIADAAASAIRWREWRRRKSWRTPWSSYARSPRRSSMASVCRSMAVGQRSRTYQIEEA
jgi:NAD(P)-dependent dehydrogenase (short-subunit alcohol dehydrogenase family)